MRLIAHNMLKCNIRGIENGYPLKIEHEKVEVVEYEYSPDIIVKLIKKINLAALRAAAKELGKEGIFTANDDEEIDPASAGEELLKEIHHLLFEVHVLEGNLVCPQSGRKFPVRDGIPNMLLNEDEM